MARTLYEIKLHELVSDNHALMLEQKHRLKNLADVDSLTEGGQDMDRLTGLHGLSAPQAKKIITAFHAAIEALSPKEAERRAFSWLRGKPRQAEHGEGGAE